VAEASSDERGGKTGLLRCEAEVADAVRGVNGFEALANRDGQAEMPRADGEQRSDTLFDGQGDEGIPIRYRGGRSREGRGRLAGTSRRQTEGQKLPGECGLGTVSHAAV